MKKVLSYALSIIMLISCFSVCSVAFAADLSGGKIILDNNKFEYIGTPIHPNVTVVTTDEIGQQITLVQDLDYTVTYTDDTLCGIATVSVAGINAYTGALTASYKIMPNLVTQVGKTDCTETSISLAWFDMSYSGITGYKVYSCNGDGSVNNCVATVSSNSAVINKLKASTSYKYCVRAYKTVGDKNYYGIYSEVVECTTKPQGTYISSVGNSKDKKSIKVTWKKVTCSEYEIQYSKNKDFSDAKTVIVGKNSTSKKISVNAKKKYYFRIRAVSKNSTGVDVIKSAWSAAMSNEFNKVYSSYSSHHVANKDRTTNLKLACKAINGTVLQPGDTFSFNKVVGKRTKAKGYRDAYVFTGPQSHQLGTGGGVCQVASTMFNAVLLANLKITERHQHSQRVTYVPLGRDAAIYWGAEDFKFTNNTNYPIKICMKVADGKVHCTLKVCEDIAPKKVSLKVGRKGNTFTLKRYVGGKVNYTTKSTY